MNRVTDTCIPEMEAMRRIENEVLKEWVRADQAGERYFPHQFMYKILLSGDLKKSYQIDPKDSWLLAAAEKNLPMFVPGWEDCHPRQHVFRPLHLRRRKKGPYRSHRH